MGIRQHMRDFYRYLVGKCESAEAERVRLNQRWSLERSKRSDIAGLGMTRLSSRM